MQTEHILYTIHLFIPLIEFRQNNFYHPRFKIGIVLSFVNTILSICYSTQKWILFYNQSSQNCNAMLDIAVGDAVGIILVNRISLNNHTNLCPCMEVPFTHTSKMRVICGLCFPFYTHLYLLIVDMLHLCWYYPPYKQQKDISLPNFKSLDLVWDKCKRSFFYVFDQWSNKYQWVIFLACLLNRSSIWGSNLQLKYMIWKTALDQTRQLQGRNKSGSLKIVWYKHVTHTHIHRRMPSLTHFWFGHD